MLSTIKNPLCSSLLLLLFVTLFACTKQDALVPQPNPTPETTLSYLSFLQDTVGLTMPITTARKEKIGTISTTSIEGKLPDTIIKKNSLIIRVTGDSARAYNNTEIFASYTDSLGNTYANTINDTTNKVTITKLEKKAKGIIQGVFTIKVSNTTKTKTFLLANGKFSTTFFE